MAPPSPLPQRLTPLKRPSSGFSIPSTPPPKRPRGSISGSTTGDVDDDNVSVLSDNTVVAQKGLDADIITKQYKQRVILESRLKRALEERDDLEVSNTDLREMLKLSEKANAVMRADFLDMQKEVMNLKDTVRRYTEKNDKLAERIDKRDQEIERLKVELAEKEDEITENEAIIERKEDIIERKNDKLEEKKQAISEAIADYEFMERKYNGIASEHEDLKDSYQDAMTEIQEGLDVGLHGHSPAVI